MLNESTYLQFELKAGTPVSLWRTADCEMHCIQGRIWITEENGGEDICLEAGQRFRLTHTGQTVVEVNGTTGSAQCRLYQVPVPSHLGRLGNWLHAWVTGLMIGRVIAKG